MLATCGHHRAAVPLALAVIASLWGSAPAAAQLVERQEGGPSRLEVLTKKNTTDGNLRAKKDAERDARIRNSIGSMCTGCGGPAAPTTRSQPPAR